MNTPVADLLRVKGADVLTSSPDASVYDAVKVMTDRGIGCLLVQDTAGKICGIITERDCRNVILKELAPRKVQVRQMMSVRVLHVEPDTSVENCMQLMTEKRIRHLPVMAHGKLAGLISIGDVVKFLCTERGREIENLEKYITGSL
jgi:CBS domain-containing protein